PGRRSAGRKGAGAGPDRPAGGRGNAGAAGGARLAQGHRRRRPGAKGRCRRRRAETGSRRLASVVEEAGARVGRREEPRNTRNTRKKDRRRSCRVGRVFETHQGTLFGGSRRLDPPYDSVGFLSCLSCVSWFLSSLSSSATVTSGGAGVP